MSSPWSAPDASRPVPVPPPPPPPPPSLAGAAPAPGPGAAPVDNPFAPPSDDEPIGPVAPGSVYGGHVPAGAYGAAPVWPTLPGNDPLAVAALVCGVAGLVVTLILPLPIAPVALGLGIAALLRINRSGGVRGGKGMAIAGVVLGGLGTVGILAMGALVGFLVWSGFGA